MSVRRNVTGNGMMPTEIGPSGVADRLAADDVAEQEARDEDGAQVDEELVRRVHPHERRDDLGGGLGGVGH